MQILISSCWHLSSTTEKTVLDRSEEVCDIIKDRQVDALFLLGDFWHSAVRLSETYPIDTAVRILKNLTDLCPVILFYGTQSHDLPGSLFFFDNLNTKNPISVIKEHDLYSFDGEKVISYSPDFWSFYALPVMSKTALIHNAGIARVGGTIKQNNDLVSSIIEEKVKQAPNANSILLGHYSTKNAKTNNNFISSHNDIVLDGGKLKNKGYAYVIQGHIHEPQEAEDVIFVGSLYPTSAGDFKERRLLLYDTDTTNLESIPITTNVTHLIPVSYEDEVFNYEYDLSRIKKEDRIVFKFKVKSVFNKPTQTKVSEFLSDFIDYNLVFPIRYEIETKEKAQITQEVIPVSDRVVIKLKDLGFSKEKIEGVMDTLNVYLRAGQ